MRRRKRDFSEQKRITKAQRNFLSAAYGAAPAKTEDTAPKSFFDELYEQHQDDSNFRNEVPNRLRKNT
jgi:hypothetical protein